MNALSSNRAQSLGSALLAAGFYGPAEGPPAMRVKSDGLLELTRPPKVQRTPGRTGLGARVLAQVPELERAEDALRRALLVGDIARRLGGVETKVVSAYLAQLSGVLRIGKPKSYRYYRLKVPT